IWLWTPRPPIDPSFPYTTLFRSRSPVRRGDEVDLGEVVGALAAGHAPQQLVGGQAGHHDVRLEPLALAGRGQAFLDLGMGQQGRSEERSVGKERGDGSGTRE